MEQTIALLIDFENIAAGTEKEGLGRFDISKVIARVKDKGRILIARSYADWGRFARFKQSLLTHNVTMYELTSHGMQDKNRADIAMVVDCLELAYTRDYVDTYVVVSGDSDFTPLVLKLKELNKRVIGIGTRRSTSRLIINACDEFIFYDSIVQKKKKKPRKSSGSVPKDREKAFELLSDVLDGMQREDPTPPHASVLKSAMLRRQPDFNENDLGFGSFTRFLEAARDASYVLLSRDKKSGGYTVDSVDDPEEGDDTPAPRSKSTSKPKGGAYDDPYFPEGVDEYVKRINDAGYCALSHPTRMAVLDELTSAVADRKKKRRRVNIPFMQEDLLKRLRNTHPDLSGDHLRDVLKGLLKAGLLMHRDGTPIRSQNASFELKDDAGKLNKGLVEFYLRTLSEDGADLSDVDKLAELFFGDADRRRDVETIIAWMAAPADAGDLDDLLEVEDTSDDDDTSDGGDDDLDDLDALLVADEPAEEKPAPKKKRSRSRKKTPAKKDEADDKADADDKAEEAAPAEEEKAPAGKSTAKKSTAKKSTAKKSTAKKSTAKKDEAPAEAEVDTPVEEIAEAAEEPAEEAKPKRTTRRRTKKATAEKKEKDAEVDAAVEATDE